MMVCRSKYMRDASIIIAITFIIFKSLGSVDLASFVEFGPPKRHLQESSTYLESAATRGSLQDAKVSNASQDLAYPAPIDVALIFTNVVGNVVLQYNLKRCVSSLLRAASAPVRLHMISDENDFSIGSSIIKEVQTANQLDTRHVKLVFVSSAALASEVRPIVEILQEHFTTTRDSYYRDFLFFFSLFLDRILPGLGNIILMDIDTVVKGDIAELNSHFSHFSQHHVMGIGPELSPVYRHVLSLYRNKNPSTKLGSPLIEGGFPGYNSGVLLINIPKLRSSAILASYLTREKLYQEVKKYSFQGTLGDQDLFTLIALEHPEIFYTLPCGWNRQLCQWWRKGYELVFDQYFNCSGEIQIYHGNCKTEIPPNVS